MNIAVLWSLGSLVAIAILFKIMFIEEDREIFTSGEMTNGHHQIESQCNACHTNGLMETKEQEKKNMNSNCLACHKKDLKAGRDSHDIKLFRDPANADRRKVLDALFCATCHLEHKPEITDDLAVTLPMDFCVACHQEIEHERPTHVNAEFMDCSSSGCHNYHDNTSLYEKYLVSAADEPNLLVPALLMSAASAKKSLSKKMKISFEGSDLVILPSGPVIDSIYLSYENTSHHNSKIECVRCHSTIGLNDTTSKSDWVGQPNNDVCQECHKKQSVSHSMGRHGMSSHPALSEINRQGKIPKIFNFSKEDSVKSKTEFKVGHSRLNTKGSASHLELGKCSACHNPHEDNLADTAINVCLECHENEHTENYFGSEHYQLYRSEQLGLIEKGAGVSCADCHFSVAGSKKKGKTFTDHNQNSNLRPREKMIRSVCSSCHGLQFSLDALADDAVVKSNFSLKPKIHVKSIDWATNSNLRD